MNTSLQKPLLTFFLMAYNQERFVRQAVEGAFRQTYSPLEIILSDDCSKDRTFEIMREVAQAYRGPHKVVLNRNPETLGISAHVNQGMKLSTGALIVVAAGDDISVPERAEVLQDAWESHGRPSLCSLYSGGSRINASGKTLGILRIIESNENLDEVISRCGTNVIGATHAWHRSLFDVFGPLPHGLNSEDRLISFRAALNNRVFCVNRELVAYRKHSGNISSNRVSDAFLPYKNLIQNETRIFQEQIKYLGGYLQDLEILLRNDPAKRERITAWQEAIKEKIAERENFLRFLCGRFIERRKLCRAGAMSSELFLRGPSLRFGGVCPGLAPAHYYLRLATQYLRGGVIRSVRAMPLLHRTLKRLRAEETNQLPSTP